MSPGVVLIVQAGAALAVPDGAGFDLRAAPSPKPCTPGGEEIVVCGRKDDGEAFRLRPLPPGNYAPKPLRAQIGLGEGKTLGLEGEQKGMPGGNVSKRIMLNFKMKF